MKNRVLISIFIFICITVFIYGCKKDNKNNAPYVDFYIDLTSIQYSALNHNGGYMYLTGGFQGILVYRLTEDTYYAYDRQCTLKSDTCHPLIIDNTGFYAFDTKCKSKYLIIDGYGAPQSGPSKVPLIHYQAIYDGVKNLHITN